jgi:predicted acetyltransferase
VPRIKETSNKSREAQRTVFWDKYASRQLRLIEIGTHPNHQKKGAAKMMLKAGLFEEARVNVAITLFASPASKTMYERFRFSELKQIEIHVEGEENALRCFA